MIQARRSVCLALLSRHRGWFAVCAVVVGLMCGRLLAQQDRPAGTQRGRPPTVTTTNPKDHPSPPQPQQHQGLEYFAGTWTFSWTGRESPLTAGPRTGTVTFTRLADSSFLAVDAEGTVEGAGAYKETGYVAWNEDKKILVLSEGLANGVNLLSVGDWSSPIGIRFETSPVRVQGQLVKLRRVYAIISASSFTITEEISTDGGPFVRLGAGSFRKKM